MTYPLLEHTLAEGCDASVEQLEQCPFLTAIERVGKYFQVDQRLSVKHQTGGLANRIIPGEITDRNQVTLNLKRPEVLDKCSKGRHQKVLFFGLFQNSRPTFRE